MITHEVITEHLYYEILESNNENKSKILLQGMNDSYA